MRLVLEHVPEQQVLAAAQNGWTALMVVAMRGNTECLWLLLEHVPEQQVSAVSNDGQTALEMACDNDHMDCAKVLLAHQSPVPCNKPSVVRKLVYIMHELAQMAEAPEMLHQAIATEAQVLQASNRRRTQ